MSILNKINNPSDMKALNIDELEKLCDEIETLIKDTINEHGGHYSSPLGVIELTVALHYIFHFSDGDNWSGNDTNECLNIMQEDLLLKANLFCYGQVDSRYGSGQFLRDLLKHFGDNNEKVITAQIKDKSAIMGSLKKFLDKGR